MAKLRIHELAKELSTESKIIIEMLKELYPGKDFKAANSIEGEDIEQVRRRFLKTDKAEKPEKVEKTEKAAKPEKAERPGSIEKSEKARPKKKASITAVFHAQYSKQGARKQNQQKGNNNSNNKAAGGTAGNNGSRPGRGNSERRRTVKPAERPHIPIRPNADRPNYDRASAHTPDDEVVKPIAETVAEKPAAEITAEKTVVKTDLKPTENISEKPKTDLAAQSQPAIKAQPKQNVYKNNVYAKQAGTSNSRGNRQDRQQNDRSGRNASSEQKTEKNYQNNRTNSNNGAGDKNNGRGGQNRHKEFKGKLDQKINHFNKETAPASEELRKESRDNNRDRDNRKKNNNNKDYDKLGGKKQERFINLEKNSGHKKKNQTPAPAVQKEEEVIKTITLPEHLTIRDLADKMKVQPSVIVKKLFLKGTMVTVNQEIDFEHAEEIALEFNCIAEPEEKIDVIAELLKEEEEDESKMVSRPPVVCVMGHVDHGKTSLLDAIRNTRVTDKEAGGITQAIGAYMVKCNGQNITFLDTPGHEAFTAMRMRGANSTDIAILVVAADDGVMPQTVEAINHAKAAGIEIIVAVNKIDKPNANVERVKQELSEYELIPSDWGGSTEFVPVSAHTHEGIEDLLEMILLTSEVLELKANPKRNARGVVIEAKLDKGRGAVATVLVQKGTLKVGQPVACGSSFGKVRAMIDDTGKNVKEAKPSMPVEILGLSSVPDAGETFVVCESEKDARNFAETYIAQSKEKLLEETRSRMSLDDLFSQIQSGNVKELDLIVKADVQGSVEAMKQTLQKLSNEEVVVKIIHGGVGAINESDVNLASASNAIIIGFNVRPDATAKATAEREGVDLRLYKVIYNAIEDISAAMKGMLDPIFEEKVIGHAEVRQIFKASGVGNIAGSYVLDGIMERGCKCRILREGEQIFEGDLASLKRFKDDVKEVKAGYECGLVFDGFNDIMELDQIEAYKMVEVPR